MCHMQYIRLKTISHKLEPAVRALATKGETRGKSRHDLDPSSNLGIPSSGSTLRVYEIWQIRQELSSEGLRISQYMALAELFDSCRPQFSQLLNWDNDTYPMASPWECQGGDHPCTNFFANNLERREGKKNTVFSWGVSSLLYLCVWELEPGLLPICENLPEDHPEAPDVTLCCEFPVHDALWRHPADRQHGVSSNLGENKGTGKSEWWWSWGRGHRLLI